MSGLRALVEPTWQTIGIGEGALRNRSGIDMMRGLAIGSVVRPHAVLKSLWLLVVCGRITRAFWRPL